MSDYDDEDIESSDYDDEDEIWEGWGESSDEDDIRAEENGSLSLGNLGYGDEQI